MNTDEKASSTELATAAGKFVIGLILVIAFILAMTRIPDWAADYGALVTYLTVFVFVSVAGRLFWSGADTLITHLTGAEK